MLAGLGATMAQGFAFGTGSALAREAVSGVMGSFSGSGDKSTPAPPQPQTSQNNQASGPCAIDQTAFMQCLQQNPGNSSACDMYYNALQACQNNNKF